MSATLSKCQDCGTLCDGPACPVCDADPDADETEHYEARLAWESDVFEAARRLRSLSAWCPACGERPCEHKRAAARALDAIEPLRGLFAMPVPNNPCDDVPF